VKVTDFKFSPQPDIELAIPRMEVEAFVVHPASPCPEPLPLVVTIPGYGETADSEYFLHKLNSHIAERYGCIVLSINYHGIRKAPQPFDFSQLAAMIPELRDCYGWEPISKEPQEAIGEFVTWAYAKGIRKLPVSFKRYLHFKYPEYLSFGLIPALDHFSAIEELAKRCQFDLRRIVLFGSSYGGYIANLMAKFAPSTFSLVIDNSGFTHVLLREVLSSEQVEGEQYREINFGEARINFPLTPSYPWTLDELSTAYFSDAHRNIRSLLIADHWLGSKTSHCIFHSVGDRLVPITEKDRMVELLRLQGRNVKYHRIERSDIEGRKYKTLEHGMDASLRALFELSVPDVIPRLEVSTDYERKAVVRFPCSSLQYEFEFGSACEFNARIHVVSQKLQYLQGASPVAL